MKKLFLLVSFALICSGAFAQIDSKVNTGTGKIVPLKGVVSQRATEILNEGFEGGVVPPTGWTLTQGPTPETWTIDDDPYSGTYNAVCLYDDTYAGTQHEMLKTPALDLSTASSATLTFYFMMSKYWGIFPNDNYDIQVAISTDNGANFGAPIWTETDTDTSSWVSWDWVGASVNLNSYMGNNQVVIAFIYHGYDGAQAGLDEIKVSIETSTTGVVEHESRIINVFPNPASDLLNIEIAENSNYIITDASGKIVYNGVATINEKIDVSQFDNGVYFVKTLSNDNVLVQRFIVSK